MRKITRKLTAALLLMSGGSIAVYAQPANDECNGAVLLTVNANDYSCGTVTSADNTGATASGSTPGCATFGAPANDVWFSFTATSAAHRVQLKNVSYDMSNNFFIMGTAVYGGSCGALTEQGCNQTTAYFVSGSDYSTPLDLTGLTIGQTYYVQVWTTYSGGGNGSLHATFDICIGTPPPPPPNDSCQNAVNISDGAVHQGYNDSADPAISPAAASCLDGTGGSGAYDVWYTVTTTAAGNLTVNNAVPPNQGQALEVFSGGCGNLVSVGCDLIGGFTNGLNTVTVPNVQANTTYLARVYDYDTTVHGSFTIQATGTALPLPVAMSALEGQITTGNLALLQWHTFSERYNKGFAVQRSDDGAVFTTTDFIAGKGIHGNSDQTLSYAYTDKNAVKGTVFYRLQQTDMDGRAVYSNTVRLTAGKEQDPEITVSPNPFKRMLTIRRGAEPVMITISDLSGKAIFKMNMAGNQPAIDLGGLAQGMYLLQVTGAGYSKMTRICKN